MQMNSNKVTRVFLVLAGLIGLSVGVGLAFTPVVMQAQYGIVIAPNNISQLSETRAPGMGLLAISTIILIGAFRAGWRYLALQLSGIVFLSYGIGRLLSLAVDGMPDEGLLMAMAIELLVGIFAFIILVIQKKKNSGHRI